ncbi:MAG: hypothetical protein LHV69_04015 [Elusimicrobia bacterium]|nr:hypothetical protein [Candidatus Obscuribacterium magneticum]
MAIDFAPLFNRANDISQELEDALAARPAKMSPVSRQTQKLIEELLHNDEFRTRALKLTYVFPSLVTDASVLDHIRHLFYPVDPQLPFLIRTGAFLARTPLARKKVAAFLRRWMVDLAEKYIPGSTLPEIKPVLDAIETKGMTYGLEPLHKKMMTL